MSAPRPDVVAAWQKHRAALEQLRDNGGLGPSAVAKITGLPREVAKCLYGAILAGAPWLGSTEKRQQKSSDCQQNPSTDDLGDLPPPPEGRDWTFEKLGNFARCWSRPGSSVRTVDDLLRVAGVDPDEWIAVDGRANSWPTSMKLKRREERPDGSATVTQDVVQVDNTQVSVKLERRVAFDAPPCPPVPFQVLKRGTCDVPASPEKVCLFVPDTQHGYRWTDNLTALDPLHDPYAIDAVRQLAAILQPDEVGFLGDMIDAAPFSPYRCPPELRQTTTPSLWALHWDLLQFRIACPQARMWVTPGNHDDRPRKKLIDQVSEAVTVRAVGSEADPFNLPGLLRLDELGIDWLGEYGDSYWLWDQVEVTHGERHGKGVHTQVEKLSHTLVQGHCHIHAMASKRVRGPHGTRLVHAVSPGTLCRVDGAVPATTKRVDWHQGCAVATLTDGVVHIHLIPIVDGVLTWGGMVIRGRDRSDELAAWMRDNDPKGIGWPQVMQHTYGRAA